MRLDLDEGRVIGSLIEKQLTTPQQYPLTLNALVAACNQSSNRDPIVSYEEGRVQQVLRRLKDAGLVRFVYPSHGRSVIRYAEGVGEHLGLDSRRLALVAVLLLRGPQTAGELRARTERMTDFEGIGAVEAELQALSEGADPLVRRLGRRPGQKEERWTQLLSGGSVDFAGGAESAAGVPADVAITSRSASALATASPAQPVTDDAAAPDGAGRSSRAASVASAGDLAALAGEVASLRDEVAAVRAALEALQGNPN